MSSPCDDAALTKVALAELLSVVDVAITESRSVADTPVTGTSLTVT